MLKVNQSCGKIKGWFKVCKPIFALQWKAALKDKVVIFESTVKTFQCVWYALLCLICVPSVTDANKLTKVNWRGIFYLIAAMRARSKWIASDSKWKEQIYRRIGSCGKCFYETHYWGWIKDSKGRLSNFKFNFNRGHWLWLDQSFHSIHGQFCMLYVPNYFDKWTMLGK